MILGDKLHHLCLSATQDLWLVAPFIKVSTLQRLLEGVAPSVHLQCVTRWRPEEIAMGVSDIDIWLLLKARENTQLWLRHDLHAKYYRSDEQCLVGSANITATALGWVSQPNIELLLDVPRNHPALRGFENQVLADAILVDDSVYEHTKAIVALIELEANKAIPLNEAFDTQQTAIDRSAWIPSLRNPEQLYVAYIGNQDKLSVGAHEVALADLQVLNIPQGLSKSAFEAYVGLVLLQMPIVQKVDIFVVQPRRFGEVSSFLKTLPSANSPDFDGKLAWQTLMRWLLNFLQERYTVSVPSHSEVFSRV